MKQLHSQPTILGKGERERGTSLFYLWILSKSKNKPRHLMTSSIFLSKARWSSSWESLGYKTTEHIWMHKCSWKTYVSCNESSLLSSIYQFLVWGKHGVSPNLVVFRKSVHGNKQEYKTPAVLRSRLSLLISRQFNLFINWQAQRFPPVLR